MKAKVITFKF